MAPNSASLSKLLLLPLVFHLARAADPSRCPAAPLAEQIENPEVLAGNPVCPQDNGKIIVADDGSHFYFACCTHENPAATFIETINTPTHKDCLNACMNKGTCASVKFDVDSGGCMLYEEGLFQSPGCGTYGHDWLYIIDPPAIESGNDQTVLCSTECPFAHGQKYVAEHGKTFHMECGKRHGTVPFAQEEKGTFQDCIDACGEKPRCVSVDYSSHTNTCYYGTHSGGAVIEASGFFSAYSFGCAGACDEEDTCACTSKCGNKAASKHDEL